MAICAACERPIIKGDQFRLVGSEVVHHGCVGHQTALQRTKLRAIELERQLAEARGLVNVARADAAHQRRSLEEALERMQRAHNSDRKLRLGLEAEYRQQRDAARAERDTARAEAERLRSEPRTPAPAPPTQVPADSGDRRDDAEVRFSLLEIDPP